VVDDMDMAVTHVIRGEDLLPTTPRGILLWEALVACGWTRSGAEGAEGAGTAGPGHGGDGPVPPLPVFAHLPMLVNEQRKKLSKRRDPVAVEVYRDQGYLAAAFVNYLGLLGWSPPGGDEVFGRDRMIDEFRLSDVNHAPAFFDVVKLTHLNGEYIRSLSIDDFINACRPWLTGGFDEATFRAIAPLVQERVATLGEVPAMVDFLFLDEPAVDEPSFDKAIVDDELGPVILARAIAAYRALERWDRDALYEATASLGEAVGRKLGKAQAPIRVAVTGRRVGPPLFESLALLGPERTLARMQAALDRAGGDGAATGGPPS
jgi:glutamyl-tRNA synthetase